MTAPLDAARIAEIEALAQSQTAYARALHVAVEIGAKRGEAIRDLLAELRRREWRTIETAPKDGKHLVDLWDGSRHTNCFFEEDKWRQIYRWTEGPKGHWAQRRHTIKAPTHWQPLPEPPHE